MTDQSVELPAVTDPSAQLADHSIEIMSRVSTEVSKHLKRIRGQLDELDRIVMKDAGTVEQAIRDHMRIAAHAITTSDTIERELGELRAMLERPRT